jgi:membrane fusion protein, copper/silver efflux system
MTKVIYLSITLAGALLLTSSCQNKATTAEGNTETTPVAESAAKLAYESSVAFQEQVKEIWTAYVGLKDALVASNAYQASEKAVAVLSALQAVDSMALSSEAKTIWRDQVQELSTPLNAIRNTRQIIQQRATFEIASGELLELVQNWGAKGATIYKQYCPMALDNKGAFWLSAESQIRNPYFGDEMLKCGEVQKVVRF